MTERWKNGSRRNLWNPDFRDTATASVGGPLLVWRCDRVANILQINKTKGELGSRVLDHGTLEELGSNPTGEIVTEASQAFRGYWRRPEEIEAAILEIARKRFLRARDIGRYGEEGYFHFVERIKRMINVGGTLPDRPKWGRFCTAIPILRKPVWRRVPIPERARCGGGCRSDARRF